MKVKNGWRVKGFSYWSSNRMDQKRKLLAHTIAKEWAKRTRVSKEYPVSVMIKLGWDQIQADTAFSTIESYEEMVQLKGETWFGTNALASGVGKRRRQEFLTAINSKKTVHMYFIIGKTGGGTNEIEFQAEVLDIESKKGGMTSPEPSCTPEEYRHQKYSIWVKLGNLQPCNEKSVADFKFANSDRLLKQALNSTCAFSYITQTHQIY